MNRIVRNLIANDRWIPALIVVVFLGLAGLEARFIFLAVSTFPGVVTEQPYEHGLHYNDVLVAEAAQKARGWTVRTSYAGSAGAENILLVSVRDKAGAPVTAALVQVVATQVTRHTQAIVTDLKETSPGNYDAQLRLPLGGRWMLRVVVRKGDAIDRHVQDIMIGGRTQS
ncbi:FixH family protein [Bradyrhizobium ontarionense]|uniref:FixH family protein n=1 Tax=Bradyrhizobium ontarionense TaxID=2898149 RepID=A0ABY3R7H8_9BRAD|nr:FixH family protein [Bradyrhizobium sp. A19]UFZ02718.1 FixH family protein [Bradyrhizobium sp. A19]